MANIDISELKSSVEARNTEVITKLKGVKATIAGLRRQLVTDSSEEVEETDSEEE